MKPNKLYVILFFALLLPSSAFAATKYKDVWVNPLQNLTVGSEKFMIYLSTDKDSVFVKGGDVDLILELTDCFETSSYEVCFLTTGINLSEDIGLVQGLKIIPAAKFRLTPIENKVSFKRTYSESTSIVKQKTVVTIKIINDGNTDLGYVNLTETLPKEMDIISHSPALSLKNRTLSWKGAMKEDDIKNFTYTFVPNTVGIHAIHAGLDYLYNGAEKTTTIPVSNVKAVNILTFKAYPAKDNVSVGDRVSFVFSMKNEDDQISVDVSQFTVYLPESLTDVTYKGFTKLNKVKPAYLLWEDTLNASKEKKLYMNGTATFSGRIPVNYSLRALYNQHPYNLDGSVYVNYSLQPMGVTIVVLNKTLSPDQSVYIGSQVLNYNNKVNFSEISCVLKDNSGPIKSYQVKSLPSKRSMNLQAYTFTTPSAEQSKDLTRYFTFSFGCDYLTNYGQPLYSSNVVNITVLPSHEIVSAGGNDIRKGEFETGDIRFGETGSIDDGNASEQNGSEDSNSTRAEQEEKLEDMNLFQRILFVIKGIFN